MKKFIFIVFCLVLLSPMNVFADQVHRVRSGETLSLIAKSYHVSVNELIRKNRYLRNPNSLVPGQVLIVPKGNYIVQSGDTLFKISKETGRSMAFIAEVNNLNNWGSLYVGQSLKIPNSYTVKPGDSLYLISKKLGIQVQFLAAENNLSNWNNVTAGQVLFLPENDDFVFLEKLLTPIANKHPNSFYFKGPVSSPKVALTFDDGPHSIFTNQILDILKQHKAKATFFLLGNNIGGRVDTIKRIVAEGHTIGNHTMTHPDIRKITSEQLSSELSQLNNTIEKYTGKRPSMFRPPYGFFNEANLNQVSTNNFDLIKWSVDSFDWRDRNVDKILINTLPGVRQGGILLFHDILLGENKTSATVAALPELIKTLKSQGYQFVTVDELLGIPAYQ